jgi:hypothetical protein
VGRRHRGRRLLLRDPFRRAGAAIASGLCETVLITHGEIGRSGFRAHPQGRRADQPRRSVRAALWADGPPTVFAIPVLRYTKNLIRPQRSLVQITDGAER